MTDRGVVYCATSQAVYLEAALISSIGLRQLNPEIPITIFCDPALELASFSTLQHSLQTYGIDIIELSMKGDKFLSRSVKTHLNELSPYQDTLYIDSDMLPLKSLSQVWDYLDHGDIAMVLDRLPRLAMCDHVAQVEIDYTLKLLPGDTHQFNSGLIVWRNNDATQSLFTRWQEEWAVFQKHDQLALMRAIATEKVAVAQMPVNYNTSPRDAAPVLLPNNDVYLLHCWGGQVASGDYLNVALQFHPKVVAIVKQLLVL
ncbi:MAG: putative nucleotide-diphospho-sugar transferase [Cyanobacteria bacterium]|nr:putative nucleotide-diphospho-sugar transferase [Cyanobacteriota bacterium]